MKQRILSSKELGYLPLDSTVGLCLCEHMFICTVIHSPCAHDLERSLEHGDFTSGNHVLHPIGLYLPSQISLQAHVLDARKFHMVLTILTAFKQSNQREKQPFKPL